MPVETVFSPVSVKEPAASRRRPAEAGANASAEGFSLPEATGEAAKAVSEADAASAGEGKPVTKPSPQEVAAAAAKAAAKAADPTKPAATETATRSQPLPVQPDAFIGTLTELLAAAQAQATPAEGQAKGHAAGLEEAGTKDAEGKKVAGKDKEKAAGDTTAAIPEKSDDKPVPDVVAVAIVPEQKPVVQPVPQAVPQTIPRSTPEPVAATTLPSAPVEATVASGASEAIQAAKAKKDGAAPVATTSTTPAGLASVAKATVQTDIPTPAEPGKGEPPVAPADDAKPAAVQAGTGQALPAELSLLLGQTGKTGPADDKVGEAAVLAGVVVAAASPNPKAQAASKTDAVANVAPLRRASPGAAEAKAPDPKTADMKPADAKAVDAKQADPKATDPKLSESKSTDPASQQPAAAAPQQSVQPQPAAQDAQQAVQQALAPIDLSALVQQAVGKAEPARLLSPFDAAAAAPNAANPNAALQAGQGALALPATPLHVVPIEIGLRALAGAKQFDIRLDPDELGRVDVNLSISDKGEVSARLVVDRVETLHLLQRDARTLERAFEQAGLKPSDSGVDISLRDPSDQSAFRQHRQQEDAPQRQRQPSRAETGGDDAVLPVTPAPQRRLVRLGGVDLSI